MIKPPSNCSLASGLANQTVQIHYIIIMFCCNLSFCLCVKYLNGYVTLVEKPELQQ